MATPRIWDRLGPVAGILFVGLFVAGIVAVGSIDADPEDPADQIAAELADATGRQSVSFLLFALSLVFFIVFMAYLRDRFDSVIGQGPARWLVPVFWGGALLYGAAFLIQGLIQGAQTILDDYGGDAQVAKALFVLGWESLFLLSPGIVLFMGAAAVLILKGDVLPKWLGWFAVLGVLAAPLPWIPIFGLWIVVTSIYLLMTGRSTAAPAAM